MTTLVHIRSGHVVFVSEDDPDRLALLQRYGYEVQVGNPGNPPSPQSAAATSPPPVPATPLASRAARAPASSSTSLLPVGPIFAGCLLVIASFPSTHESISCVAPIT